MDAMMNKVSNLPTSVQAHKPGQLNGSNGNAPVAPAAVSLFAASDPKESLVQKTSLSGHGSLDQQA